MQRYYLESWIGRRRGGSYRIKEKQNRLAWFENRDDKLNQPGKLMRGKLSWCSPCRTTGTEERICLVPRSDCGTGQEALLHDGVLE
jgi:hypothetical protein